MAVQYASGLGVTAACTAVAYPLYPRFDSVNLVMIYLLGATASGLQLGRAPAAMNALASVLAFDFFFLPPTFSFAVANSQYLFTLVVMLTVALVISNLMISIRRHQELADAREHRTAILYAMSRELATAATIEDVAAVAVRHISAIFDADTIVLRGDAADGLAPAVATRDRFDPEVAKRVATQGEPADGETLYLPLRGSRHVIGVIVLRPQPEPRTLPADALRLLETFAAQLALSMERVQLTDAAEEARVFAERATLRNTLLTSISHDLRTPLAAIAGAGSLIAQPTYALTEDRRNTLGSLIERKARDMTQLLSNVLDLMRMEFKAGPLRADWHAVEDLVAVAVRATDVRLVPRRLVLDIPADLPPVWVDATLVVQILGNLLENAAKYTPTGATVTISADLHADMLSLIVADDGPGFPEGDPERLFERFQRGRAENDAAGSGLGLAICRAAARLHGGDVRASHNAGGGARFSVSLPHKNPLATPLALAT